ncbi:MAG: YcxB family protein [Oscillospiraceae bacterium]|nr:YcxB family protein [Oscillospiraceae bacterium]
MTAYRRDFTIGLRETRDFYVFLALGHWRKGIIGFGAVGALAALLYTAGTGLSLPVQAAAAACGALAAAIAAVLAVVISTRLQVKEQIRRSGRESYVQETEINGFGIHVAVGQDRARLAFENLVRVAETGKAFYLFLSAGQAWILPKKQMEDPQEESAQLRDIFRTVVERGKLRLKG